MRKFLVVLGALALVACASVPVNSILDSANYAQAAAAATYQDASSRETAAAVACRAALTAKGSALPTMPAQTATACAAVGVPLPFDPVKLENAAAGINTLYDGIRAANVLKGQLAAGASMPTSVLTDLASYFTQVVADLTGAGVTLPPSVTSIAGQLQAAAGWHP